MVAGGDADDDRAAGTGAPELTYVVPAHNSSSVIETTLDALVERLSARSAEVVVVENGSRDRTPEVLDRLSAAWDSPVALRVTRSEKGLGNAYRAGLAASRGHRVVLTADDLPFGFDDLDAADAIDPVEHPVVIGSKGHPESVVGRAWPRRLMTWGFAVLRRAVLGVRTRDPQGTFVLHGDWARAVTPHLAESGYLVTTELCYLAERAGITPVEVPIRLSQSHHEHASRIRLGDVGQMAVGLLGIRRRHAAEPPDVAAPPAAPRPTAPTTVPPQPPRRERARVPGDRPPR